MQIDRAQLTLDASDDAAIEPRMTADQVAAALGVNRKFVYARHHSGALRGYKLGPLYRFRPADVRAFIEASVAPPDGSHRPRQSTRRMAAAGSFRALLDGRAA